MLNGHDGTIDTFLHHNPTNTSLHTKKDQGSFLGLISAVLMFGMKVKLNRPPRVSLACGNFSVMPECSNQLPCAIAGGNDSFQ